MPTIINVLGFRFFFYSREESRMHVHVEYQGKEAKIWMDNFEVAENRGMHAYQLKRIIILARFYEKEIKEKWNSHFR